MDISIRCMRIQIYIYIYVCMYIYIYICMHACYVCMHACMYICRPPADSKGRSRQDREVVNTTTTTTAATTTTTITTTTTTTTTTTATATATATTTYFNHAAWQTRDPKRRLCLQCQAKTRSSRKCAALPPATVAVPIFQPYFQAALW